MARRSERARVPIAENRPKLTEIKAEARPIPPNRQASAEINLVELFYYMLERAWLIAVAAIVAAAIAWAYTQYFVTPLYQSTATLYVFKSKDSAVGVDVSGLTQASQLTNDYIELFNLTSVNAEVIRQLRLPYSATQLRSMLTVVNPANTRYLKITVKSPDAQEARDIANAYGVAAKKTINEKMHSEEPTELDEALVAKIPVLPDKMKNVMNGGLIGAMLAAGVFFLIFIMDDKIKSTEDLSRYYSYPTLAVLPMVGAVNVKPIPQNGKYHKRTR
jgi:capsular polysaccharide biosynthesis protein